jgi:hypothetical protein
MLITSRSSASRSSIGRSDSAATGARRNVAAARTKIHSVRCRSPIETSSASPTEMSRSTVGLGLVGVAWDDGDHDEPRRADTAAGADRYR